MRIIKRITIYLFLLFLLSNFPPITGTLTAILVDMKGTAFGFVTKDLHFCMFGGIERVSASEAYKKYKIKYPHEDHELYRFSKSKDYRWFWRYGEYLFSPDWRVQFLEVPPDFNTERYYGSYIDERPSYKWNETTSRWVKIP